MYVVNVYREEEQVQKPHLVVVPLSTFPNWEREFALWAPQLNVVPFIGNQAGRTVIKTHELYADPSQVKGKTKAHGRPAELQVSIHGSRSCSHVQLSGLYFNKALTAGSLEQSEFFCQQQRTKMNSKQRYRASTRTVCAGACEVSCAADHL